MTANLLCPNSVCAAPPKLFSAVHSYCASSPASTDTNTKLFDSIVAVSDTGFSSNLDHVILGAGYPVALHRRLPASPSYTANCSGPTETVGAPDKKLDKPTKRRQLISYSLYTTTVADADTFEATLFDPVQMYVRACSG